tara:strand:+ start:1893 stop:2099 length:207 start_codon:yes stop_codon:yes gene_type:complete
MGARRSGKSLSSMSPIFTKALNFLQKYVKPRFSLNPSLIETFPYNNNLKKQMVLRNYISRESKKALLK